MSDIIAFSLKLIFGQEIGDVVRGGMPRVEIGIDQIVD